jgi:tRNA (cmo5U34)-methyltransferase
MSGVQALMRARYGGYLESLQGEGYRRKVFDYLDREDSPRPVTCLMDLLRRGGVIEVDLLHKNSCFAAFGGRKGHPASP